MYISLLSLVLLFLGCGENKKGHEQNGSQIVSPAARSQELDASEIINLDEQPQIIKKVPPKYPESAIKARVQGAVYVRALINQAGRVEKTVVLKRVDGSPELEESALEAVQQWIFTPAKVNGQPTSTWVVIPFKFQLRDKSEQKLQKQ